VADYAEGELAEPPPLLELGFECQQFRALPYDGGLYDQPAGLLKKIRMVLNVHHAYLMYQRHGQKPGEMAKWRRNNEELWNIVSDIDRLREQYG
jgi:hypothetical protein